MMDPRPSKAWLILALVTLFLAAGTLPKLHGQTLPPFSAPEDAKEWLYTVKPTQLLDYLVRASKIENEAPVIVFPGEGFLILQDGSLYVEYTSPLEVTLGKDIMKVTATPPNRKVEGFLPPAKDLTLSEAVIVSSVVGGVGVLIGVLVGLLF